MIRRSSGMCGKAICVLSRKPYFNFFRKYLTQMYLTLTNCSNVSLSVFFQNLLLNLPMFPPGSALQFCVQVSPTPYPLSYSIPGPRDFPILDISLRHLFQVLDLDKIILLITAILTEQQNHTLFFFLFIDDLLYTDSHCSHLPF